MDAVGDRLLNIVELAEVLGVRFATIYDWRYQGHTDRFPPTVRLGPLCAGAQVRFATAGTPDGVDSLFGSSISVRLEAEFLRSQASS